MDSGLEGAGSEYDEGIYTSEFSRQTYEAMLDQAGEVILAGRSVVLDATFRRREDRNIAVSVAERLGTDYWIVECVTPEEIAKVRLEDRAIERQVTSSDGRWELYDRQKAEWEPVKEVAEGRYLRLDTSGEPDDTIRDLLYQLFHRVFSEQVSPAAGVASGSSRSHHLA